MNIQERLQVLVAEKEARIQEKSANPQQQKRKEQDLHYLEEKIVNLSRFQQLKPGDWVRVEKQIGQISELNLSPGGLPQVWVSWDGSVPEPVHRLDKLIVLEANWHQGFLKGQQVKLDNEFVSIVKFHWSEEKNCVLPLVQNHQTGEEKLVDFEDLVLERGQGSEVKSLGDKAEVREQKLANNNLTQQRAPISCLEETEKIIIDPELKSLIPILSPEERAQLENNLISEGCRDPLVIWKGYNILLDGHNRYEICVKNGLNYELIEIELPDRESAHLWMMRNQLGRRNLQPEALAYFREMLYEKTKIKITNPAGIKGKKDFSEDGGQNVHHQSKANLKTEEILAQEFKVNPRTIRRAAKYAQAVDQIAEVVGSEIRPQILSRTTEKKLSKKKTLELAKAAKHKPEEIIEFFQPGTIPSPSSQAFPFSVGEVVRIVTKDHPDLRGKGGCWAIITQVHDFSCDLELWNGRITSIAAEYLVSLELSPVLCEQMKALCARLSKIREVARDPIIFVNLQFLARLKTPELTPIQQQLLEYFEKIQGLRNYQVGE